MLWHFTTSAFLVLHQVSMIRANQIQQIKKGCTLILTVHFLRHTSKPRRDADDSKGDQICRLARGFSVGSELSLIPLNLLIVFETKHLVRLQKSKIQKVIPTHWPSIRKQVSQRRHIWIMKRSSRGVSKNCGWLGKHRGRKAGRQWQPSKKKETHHIWPKVLSKLLYSGKIFLRWYLQVERPRKWHWSWH